MTREELEHIIRASADVTNQYEFVIIGSQSMLGAKRPIQRGSSPFLWRRISIHDRPLI